jgi:hypothetical protein
MMVEKGFVRMSEEEIAALEEGGQTEKQKDDIVKKTYEETTEMKKQEILKEYRRRAETFEGSPKADELTKLTQRIKALKKDEGGDTEKIRQLQERRTELIRQEMTIRQHQIELAQLKDAMVKETEEKAANMEVIGSDEL